MELSVLERLMLLDTLPQEGDITTIRIVRELREALSFGEEESARIELRTESGRTEWKQDAETPKDVDIGPRATAVIVGALEELNKQKKLNEQHIPLFDKFMGAGE